MKNKKILIVGYFGYENNQLDGQTVKTRNIFNLLKSKEKEFFKEVGFFDTQSFQQKKNNLLKAFQAIYKADILYYLPAHNNLKYIFPFIFILCKIKNIDIHYIVVGGWLSDYLNKKPIHKWMLGKINGIYPQTQDLTEGLSSIYGFNNVFQLHNFRVVKKEIFDFNKSSDIIKLVFMARVQPLKGVRTLFKISEELSVQNIEKVIIDIYGPIDTSFKKEFDGLLSKHHNINYKGILKPDEIHKTLSDYDLMLFPTQYFTEGFPGSILDAYISGIPVLVTAWKYVNEFIEDGVSGVIAQFNNEQDFINKSIHLIKHPDILIQLKDGAILQKAKYSPEIAWETLYTQLVSN